MKICIISMTNLFLCPYVDKYLSLIPSEVEIELVYWNRHGVDEVNDRFIKTHTFSVGLNERSSRFVKLKYFLKFKSYCERIIKRTKYDRVIVLHNYMAILLKRTLKRKYSGEYLIDIRDYSFENNRVFFSLEESVIKNSGMAVISSEGYTSFLPKWDYVICHNDPLIRPDNEREISQKRKGITTPIQISFIGLVRFFEQNKKLLGILGNDERFMLAFYGQNSNALEEYATDAGINNVLFKGRFKPEETVDFYMKTDVINNYYGNHSPVLDYALSNKLYYAAAFRMPILVCEDTYMYQLSKEYSFGVTIPESPNAADLFYNELLALDWDKLEQGCDRFLKKVAQDNRVFKERLHQFLNINQL